MNRTLEDYLKESGEPSFESVPRYFRDGDFVAFFSKDDVYYAQKLDQHVTVYISEQTGEMIGCKIKGVTRLINQLGDFSVEVTDHGRKVMLGLLFLTAATFAEMSNRHKYAEIAKKVGKESVDVKELFQSCSSPLLGFVRTIRA